MTVIRFKFKIKKFQISGLGLLTSVLPACCSMLMPHALHTLQVATMRIAYCFMTYLLKMPSMHVHHAAVCGHIACA